MIVDETEGHRPQAYMDLKQDHVSARKPLFDFLMEFGVMLPRRNFSAPASDDDQKAFTKQKTISPDSFTAHLLTRVGRICVKWIDVLACHLEFDPTRTRFTCFGCTADTTLHCCAAPPNAASHWATRDEVDDLLRETMLSYRLLFGQDKRSRQLFRFLDPFSNLPSGCTDRLLLELCGKKIALTRSDYELAIVAQHFADKRRRTWRELWNDKRDSASWFTFWAVLIIGGTGILLGFTQVALQIAQIALEVKSA
ncbi:hypothetical protein EK21DRAFT_97086 [Setomelanomma holmii]|uniref:Uncharacterized protein n=1 Tax=Setomelanomma holmii TaxID=210430 RepID=A0A9P4HIX3_9PLEO|nr:hypothetical protein EK21DRAFT_97086 [Setomelanomma holmii]